MGFRVSLTRLAQADLAEIVDYIFRENPAAARRVGLELVERLRTLEKFPMIGRMVPEFGEENLREIVYSHYRIVYRLHPETTRIDVVRIWHGARGELEVNLS